MRTTLINNGLLFTGDQHQKASIQNILIDEKGTIVKISSQPILAPGAQVIDASGQWIVPGFVDSHTHYDAELIASPGLKESVRHGVTTVSLHGYERRIRSGITGRQQQVGCHLRTTPGFVQGKPSKVVTFGLQIAQLFPHRGSRQIYNACGYNAANFTLGMGTHHGYRF